SGDALTRRPPGRRPSSPVEHPWAPEPGDNPHATFVGPPTTSGGDLWPILTPVVRLDLLRLRCAQSAPGFSAPSRPSLGNRRDHVRPWEDGLDCTEGPVGQERISSWCRWGGGRQPPPAHADVCFATRPPARPRLAMLKA